MISENETQFRKEASLRDAFGETLAQIGETNSSIIVVDADVSKSTKTVIFAEKFPERFFNVGISEQDMVSIGAGLASCNKTPFVVTFASFLTTRGLDQIRNMVAYSKLNVKLIGTHAGLTTGKDGATHQALEDISIMRNIPNMEVYSPSDALEVIQMVKYMANKNGPAYMRLPRASGIVFHDENYRFEPNKIEVMGNFDENGIVIFATGLMVASSIQVIKLLSRKGLKIGLVNVHTLKPIDHISIMQILEHCSLVVSIEDHNIIGGLGTSIAEIIAEENVCVKLLRLGVNDTFGESGSVDELLGKHGLIPEKISNKILNNLKSMRSSTNNVSNEI